MSKKIVIVAGAGANRDFTITNNPEKFFFPSGEELVNKIANIPNPIHSTFSHYDNLGHLAKHYQPFSIDELLDSVKKDKILTAIDALGTVFHRGAIEQKLSEEQKEYIIQSGKEMIAYHLLRSEKIELFKNIDAKIWYRHIRNLIITGKDDAEISENIANLTIVSFNYDRSLDYYLRTRLAKDYSQIQKRIFYPYGKLAEDNWNFKDYGYYSNFNKISGSKDAQDFQVIKHLASGLKVIGELGDEINRNIHNSLQEADKIYFLGFAFHKQNCELLGLKNLDFRQKEKHIYYTNFEKSLAIDENVNNIFAKTPDSHRHKSVEKGVYDALRLDFSLSFD